MPIILVKAIFSTKNFQSVGLPTNNITSPFFWIERDEFVNFFLIIEWSVWGKKALHLPWHPKSFVYLNIPEHHGWAVCVHVPVLPAMFLTLLKQHSPTTYKKYLAQPSGLWLSFGPLHLSVLWWTIMNILNSTNELFLQQRMLLTRWQVWSVTWNRTGATGFECFSWQLMH